MGRRSLFNNRIGTEFGSKKWLSLDPCGLTCVTLSYSIHIYALITMYFHLIPHSSSTSDIADHDNHSHSRTDAHFDNMAEDHDSNNKQDGFATAIQIIFYTLYIPMTIMALLSLLMAQHSNPGAVPLGARPLPVISSPLSSPIHSNHSSTGEELQNDTYIDNHNANTNGNDDGNNLLTSLYPADVTNSNNGQLDNIDINVPRTNNDGTSTSTVNASLSPTNSQKMKLKRRRGIRRCRKCNDNYKPPRAHHDSVTGRCIVKFDHFCPWVGNAVGALNHKFFFLFVLYTFLSSILSIIIIIIQFFRCGFSVPIYDQYYPNSSSDHSSNSSNSSDYDNNDISTDDMNAMDNYNHTNYTNHNNERRFLQNDDDSYDTTFKYTGCESIYSLSVILLLIVSFIFLFFTCCMLVEQWDAIESNTSKIARMKMRMGHADAEEYKRVSQDFNEFFGVGFGSKNGNGNSMALHWFLPLPIRFPPGTRDKVLGYEYRDEWYGLVYDEGMDDEVDDEDDEEEDEYDLEIGRSRKRKEQDDEGAVEINDFSSSSEHSDSVNGMHRRARTSSTVFINEEEESRKEQLELELGLSAGSEDVKQRKAVKKRISFRDDISTGSASSGTNTRSGNESKLSLKVV